MSLHRSADAEDTPPVSRQRRSNRHASRSYQMRSLSFVQSHATRHGRARRGGDSRAFDVEALEWMAVA